MANRRVWLVWMLAWVASSCDSGTGCVEGETRACTCTDGRSGAQVCEGDDTLGACVCTAGREDAGADGGMDSGVPFDAGRDGGRIDGGRDGGSGLLLDFTAERGVIESG